MKHLFKKRASGLRRIKNGHYLPPPPSDTLFLLSALWLYLFYKAHSGSFAIRFFFMCLFGCTGLVAALEIFDLHCSMRNIWLSHVGPSSLIRNQTQASCTESLDSQPLDQQGSPIIRFLKLLLPLRASSVSDGSYLFTISS